MQLTQLTYDHSGNSNQYPVHNEFSPFWLLRTQLFPDLDKFQGTVQPTAVLPLATRTSHPCIHKSVFSKGSRILTLLLSALFFLLWYSASWILATLASPNSDFCLLGSVRQLFPLSTAVWKTPWGVSRDDHRAALYSLLSGIMVPNNLFSSV